MHAEDIAALRISDSLHEAIGFAHPQCNAVSGVGKSSHFDFIPFVCRLFFCHADMPDFGEGENAPGDNLVIHCRGFAEAVLRRHLPLCRCDVR